MVVWTKKNHGMWYLHKYDPGNLTAGTDATALIDACADVFNKALLKYPRADQLTLNYIAGCMTHVLNDFPGLSCKTLSVCRGGIELYVHGANISVNICNLSPSEYERRAS